MPRLGTLEAGNPKENTMGMRRKANFRAFLALVMLTTASVPAFPDTWTNAADDVSMELVGQVNNTPTSSFQFGYLTYINGIDTATIFNGTPHDQTTALFSFSNDTTTRRVIANGPMRIIDRDGKATIYFNPAPVRSFADPDSFAEGTAILTASLRHQVIVDTITQSFTATFVLTVTSNESFSLGDESFRLGKVGQTLRLTFIGHLNTPVPPAPPAAHIAGFVVGGDLTRLGTD
jgi:hypothetical protein